RWLSACQLTRGTTSACGATESSCTCNFSTNTKWEQRGSALSWTTRTRSTRSTRIRMSFMKGRNSSTLRGNPRVRSLRFGPQFIDLLSRPLKANASFRGPTLPVGVDVARYTGPWRQFNRPGFRGENNSESHIAGRLDAIIFPFLPPLPPVASRTQPRSGGGEKVQPVGGSDRADRLARQRGRCAQHP